MLMDAPRVVVDTNVVVAAMIRGTGDNRAVLRACFEDRLRPLVGQALFLEYEQVMGRDTLFRNSPLSKKERTQLLEAFLSTCEWVQVFFLWRPNLRDEGDNHVLELAVAGGASFVVTNNVSDFRGSQLNFPEIRIVTPREMKEALR
jgi:putative PIN family toxin of toxin-antitoxin system